MSIGNRQDLSDYRTDNIFDHNIDPVMLVDEVSTTEFYIGYSQNGKLQTENNWRIKRIWKIGSVWNFGFPNGNQNFGFKWTERDTYTYSA